MFHLSPLQLVLMPSWALNVKTKNGHQQGGVIDGADICAYPFQVIGNISFPSTEAHLSLFLSSFISHIQYKRPASSLIHSISLALCVSDREQ